MATEVNSSDPIVQTLRSLHRLLMEAGQSSWGHDCLVLADALEAPPEDMTRGDIIRHILALYRGGMGGFLDLVLQDSRGVSPAMKEFDRLRSLLFEQARAELR